MSGPEDDAARQALEKDWGTRIVGIPRRHEVLEWSLGAGETKVLSVAMERPGWTAIIDDAEARMCARSLKISIMGTLGVVLRAKRQGQIPSAAAIMRSLRQAGLYLGDRFIRDALWEVAGEEWSP